MELLRDPVWQFVGAALTIFTIFGYYLQRLQKALSYEILSVTPLLTVNEALEGRLRILYDDEPTRDISLLMIKIFNSGNMPISKSDYEKSIVINTGTDSKIFSCSVVKVEPQNLDIKIKINLNQIEIEPFLFNSKDFFELKVLISGYSKNINATCRILGVKKITQYARNSTFSEKMYSFYIFTGSASLFYLFYFNDQIVLKDASSITKFGVLFLLFLGTLTGIRLVYKAFVRKID